MNIIILALLVLGIVALAAIFGCAGARVVLGLLGGAALVVLVLLILDGTLCAEQMAKSLRGWLALAPVCGEADSRILGQAWSRPVASDNPEVAKQFDALASAVSVGASLSAKDQQDAATFHDQKAPVRDRAKALRRLIRNGVALHVGGMPVDGNRVVAVLDGILGLD